MKPVVCRRTFDAIGTKWDVVMDGALPDVDCDTILRSIRKRIDMFDRRYSRFRRGTMVDIIAQNAGSYVIDGNEQSMWELYRDLYEATDGLFTPLVGQTLSDTGYDADYTLSPRHAISTVPAWDDVMSYHDGMLEIRVPSLLDFGAAGKGYIIDVVSDIIRTAGIRSYCVDAGGDIYRSDHNGVSITVGLEHPDNTAQIIGTTTLANGSICASAGNRRSWGAYHHIIDPRTRTSPKHIKAVWVKAASAMLADALATCLFLVPPKILTKYDFDYLMILPDMTVEKSGQFDAELYYNKS